MGDKTGIEWTDATWSPVVGCSLGVLKNERTVNLAGGYGFHGAHPRVMRNVGKHAAGRELDGRTWDEYPEVSR